MEIILNFLNDPIVLIILFIGVLVGLIIKSRTLIIIVFAIAAIAGLRHTLLGNFIQENPTFASVLFIGGMVLLVFILIYNVFAKVK